jgi:hypothetical protein
MRGFTESGELCGCPCHGTERGVAVKHIRPCCKGPRRVNADRGGLVEWLLKDRPEQDGLELELSQRAVRLVYLPGVGSPSGDIPPKLLGIPCRRWDVDHPAAIARLSRNGVPLEIVELVENEI